jgi:hypothetical protein
MPQRTANSLIDYARPDGLVPRSPRSAVDPPGNRNEHFGFSRPAVRCDEVGRGAVPLGLSYPRQSASVEPLIDPALCKER